MEMNIGATIAAMRKARGVTQEQLAQAVGVSTPAVSKWETGATCPDIALLCPIARFLDATVDQLLSFQATLSDEEVAQCNARLIETFERDGYEAMRAQAEALLHQYPNSALLKYIVASLYPRYAPAEKGEAGAALSRAIDLMCQVYAEGGVALQTPAGISLASMYLGAGRLEEAERTLDALPQEGEYGVQALYIALYRKQGKKAAARKLTERSLYMAVRKVLLYLTGAVSAAVDEGDFARAKALADAYQNTVDAFQTEDVTQYDLFLSICLKSGDLEGAQAWLGRSAEALAELRMDYTNHPFFSSTEMKASEATLRTMKKAILRAWQQGEELALLRDTPAYAAAVARLEAAVAES